MKNNSIFFLFLIIISQSTFTTQFEIRNMTNYPYIEVDPIWTGNSRGWRHLTSLSPHISYDSGIHSVKKILWRIPSGWCWNANIEKEMGSFITKFRKKVIIRLYDGGKYTIDLTTQGFVQGLPRQQADKGNC
jgi:hypothetical protein